MSYVLENQPYDDHEDLLKKDLLAYVDYGKPYGKRILSWPRYVIDGDDVSPISASAFPDAGCLPMNIADGSPEKSKIEDMFGNLVIMRVNEGELRGNYFYGRDQEPHKYNSIINFSKKPGQSVVEFRSFASHNASCRLVQVVYLEGGKMDFSRKPSDPVFPYDDQAAPVAKFVMVAQVSHGKRLLYGPFEMQEAAGRSDAYEIDALQSFDRFVYAVDEASFKFNIDVERDDGMPFAQFVDVDELRELIKDPVESYDWMSASELLDACGRLAKSALPNITKSDVKALKAAIESADYVDSMISMSPKRRKRLLDMLDSRESWDEMSDERKAAAIGEIPVDKLAEYVLSDDHFARFYEKVSENDEVRRRAEAREAEATARVTAAEAKAAAAEAKAKEADAERIRAESARDEQKRQIMSEIQEELDEKGDELRQLDDDRSELENRINELREGEYAAKSAIRKVVNDFQEEQAVSEHILKSVAVQELVESLGAPSGARADGGRSGEAKPEAVSPAIVPDQGGMKPGDVLRRIEGAVVDRAGREFSGNEVANILICLTQGYITTFAGYPGTGKTSLAGILAGALGLAQPSARRYSEVSVERGWTSYKDFVGYYNPFSQRVEPANSAAFSAFSALDLESRADAAEHVPYLMLLDEANLSSIEHYWSPFLLACDRREGSPELSLSLGGGSSFSVPSWLRFVATVNFDHTTEELSPRFLDRSWVIMLEPQDFDFDNDDFAREDADFSSQEALSIETLQSAFGPRSGALDVSSASRLREVVEACREAGMSVSPRSQVMMRNYISAAQEVMDVSTAATADDPVDFAVCQKVLPRISGTEESAKPVLEAILGVGGLPRTKWHAERMLKAGEGSGFYQFFA